MRGVACFTRVAGTVMLTSRVANARDFCEVQGGPKKIDFDVDPVLVVNSDAIMDMTFGDVGLSGGDPREQPFPLVTWSSPHFWCARHATFRVGGIAP